MKKMRTDCVAKIRHKNEIIKSKEKRLKGLRDNEKRHKPENDKLHKELAMKEAEVISLDDVIEENKRLEVDNKNLSQEVKELEGKVAAMSKDCKKSKTEVEVLIDEVKAWKEKHKKLENSCNLVN